MPIRLNGEPDNQRPDKWSSVLFANHFSPVDRIPAAHDAVLLKVRVFESRT
jgi:hypothetical protein